LDDKLETKTAPKVESALPQEVIKPLVEPKRYIQPTIIPKNDRPVQSSHRVVIDTLRNPKPKEQKME
jgi:hypothetical protein